MVFDMTTTGNELPTEDCVDTPEQDIVTAEECRVKQGQNETLPLPPKKKAKVKVLQIRCRTTMKEIIGATYLIKEEEFLRELAEDIEGIYAKAKTMLPKEDGMPLEEDSCRKKLKTEGEPSSNAAKNSSKTQPLPLLNHDKKKHPANGRFGAKAEWQRKLIGQKRKSTKPVSENKKPLKRRRIGNPVPSEKKVKRNVETPGAAGTKIDSNLNGSVGTPTSSASKPTCCSQAEECPETSTFN